MISVVRHQWLIAPTTISPPFAQLRRSPNSLLNFCSIFFRFYNFRNEGWGISITVKECHLVKNLYIDHVVYSSVFYNFKNSIKYNQSSPVGIQFQRRRLIEFQHMHGGGKTLRHRASYFTLIGPALETSQSSPPHIYSMYMWRAIKSPFIYCNHIWGF